MYRYMRLFGWPQRMFITIIRPSICGQAPSKTMRPLSSLLKSQKMKPWMNAPDCDEPTVYVHLTVPEIGFEHPHLGQPSRSGGKSRGLEMLQIRPQALTGFSPCKSFHTG